MQKVPERAVRLAATREGGRQAGRETGAGYQGGGQAGREGWLPGREAGR